MVECGVGRGLTLYMLGYFMAARRSTRRLYGFDSFEGFPPPTAADTSDRRPVAGDLWADTSLTHVAEHFRYGELQEFFNTTTAWYEQVRKWPTGAVVKFVKLGDKVLKALGLGG